MIYNNVFFVSSYLCVRKTLSKLELKENSLIVLSDYSQDINKFLKSLLKKNINIDFHIVKSFGLIDFILFKNLFSRMKNTNESVKFLINKSDQTTNFYFFNSYLLVHFFLILNKLLKKRRILFKENIYFTHYNLTNKKLKLLSNLMFLYNLIYKIDLNIVNFGGIENFQWKHRIKDTEFKSLTWFEIKDKYRINFNKLLNIRFNYSIKKSTLYIHQHFGQEHNIDFVGTLEKITIFLKDRIKNGETLFIKNHPDSPPIDNLIQNFKNLGLSSIYEIEQSVPVELFVGEFLNVYTICSTGIEPFLNVANCYSLYNLVSFTEPDVIISAYISQNLEGIKFI